MFHDMKVVSGELIKSELYHGWWSRVEELGAPPWEEVPSEYKDSMKQVVDWLKKEKGIPIFSQLRDAIIYGKPPEQTPSDIKVELWDKSTKSYLDVLVNSASTFKRQRQIVPLLKKMGASILVFRSSGDDVVGSAICFVELDGNAIVVASSTESMERTAMLIAVALGKDGWHCRKVEADYGVGELSHIHELRDSFIIHAPDVDVNGTMEREVPPGVLNEMTATANKFCESCEHRVRRLSCPGNSHAVVCQECGGNCERISSDEEEQVGDISPEGQDVWFASLLDKMNPLTQSLVARETRQVTYDASGYVTLRLGSRILRSLSEHQINVAALIIYGDRGGDTEQLLSVLSSRKLDENNAYALVWWAYMCLKWGGTYCLPCPTDSFHAESFAEALCPMLGIERDGGHWVTRDGRTANRCYLLVAEELVDRGPFPRVPLESTDWASLGL